METREKTKWSSPIFIWQPWEEGLQQGAGEEEERDEIREGKLEAGYEKQGEATEETPGCNVNWTKRRRLLLSSPSGDDDLKSTHFLDICLEPVNYTDSPNFMDLISSITFQYPGIVPTYPVISATSFPSTNRRTSSFSPSPTTTTSSSVMGGFYPASTSGMWYSKPCYFKPCHKHYPGGTYYPYSYG